MKEAQTVTTFYNPDGTTTTTNAIGPGQESSVEITQSAKGEPKVTVKVYDADPQRAVDEAIRLYRYATEQLNA